MERYDFRTKRLFVDMPLSAERPVETDRAQANYLLNVLRLSAGSNVLLFNGRDGEWLGRLEPDGRKSCRIVPVQQTRPQPQPQDLWYCFAPLKQARLDYMVQKAVEMGAGLIRPVITRHTQVTRLNIERMQANAIEAAEQCGILAVPRCAEPVALHQMVAEFGSGRALVFCDESAADADAIDLLRPIRGRPLAVLVGPEGGFSEEERRMLAACDFVTAIPLGPRILRADTAGVAALALVQAVAGDWR
jgi:16S rRNA (uracil1498-N3)-methyltransferase